MAENKTNEIATTQETKQEVKQNTSGNKLITDYSKGIFGTSDNFLMATQMAKALAASTIVPKDFQGKWENCLIAIEQAQRLNMSPMMIMQNMYIIYGRPSYSSKFLIGMINNSGKYDAPLRFKEELDSKGNPFACTAWTTQNGEVIEGMTVTMDMAKAEGWIDKNGSKWKTMPQLMLRYRAASFFSSLNCPEITMGLYTEDEAREIGEAEDITATTIEAIKTIEDNTGAIPVDTEEQEEPEKKEKAKKKDDPEPVEGEQTAIPGF